MKRILLLILVLSLFHISLSAAVFAKTGTASLQL